MLLTLVMLLGLVSPAALAAEPGTEEEPVAEPVVLAAAEGVDPDRYGWTAFKDDSNADNLIGAYNALVAGIGDTAESINISNYELTVTEMGTVMEAVLSDYPEYFWVGTKSGNGINYYSYTVGAVDSDTVTNVKPTYNTHKEDQAAVKNEADQLLAGLPYGSDYETALEIHDRLAEHVTYGTDPDDQNIYSALVTGTTVCAGYARAYQYLLNQVGIKVWYISGTSDDPASGESVGHAWNVIYLDDAKAWYYVDVTWDDQVLEDESGQVTPVLFHAYFLQSGTRMGEDHTADTGFYAGHLPDTGTEDNYYFAQNDNGTMVSTFNANEVAEGMNFAGMDSTTGKYTYTGHFYVTENVDTFFNACGTGMSEIASALSVQGVMASAVCASAAK